MREREYFVYIMASKTRVIYTGVTNSIVARVLQHKTDRLEGFTKRYRVHRLVYFESYRYIHSAIAREKEIKHWVRQRRVELIESTNPTWEDLAQEWYSAQQLSADFFDVSVKYDPSTIQTFSNETREGPFLAPKRLEEERTPIRFRASKVQSFGGPQQQNKSRSPAPHKKIGSDGFTKRSEG